MAALERIHVALSPYEKVQILRAQLEEREQELIQLTADTHDKLQLVETQRYLETLSPYYAANPQSGLPTREELDALETRRQQLHDLVQTIEATIPTVLQEKGAATAPPATPAVATPDKPAGPARKARFDSF